MEGEQVRLEQKVCDSYKLVTCREEKKEMGWKGEERQVARAKLSLGFAHKGLLETIYGPQRLVFHINKVFLVQLDILFLKGYLILNTIHLLDRYSSVFILYLRVFFYENHFAVLF